ncbi:MAG: VWA domain-containing protein [Bacteroidales bacterium]|nr:VWA domain-containing protein [Bacteroidales bacterium]
MIQFEHINILYGLLLVPVMVAVYIYLYYRHKKAMAEYGESSLLSDLMQDRSKAMQHVKFIILCLAWCAMIFALANPQKGSGQVTEKRKGINIMFCVDVSNSMLAEDYVPNRIEAAKRSLISYIDKLKGDRIGVVIFAGKSFVQLPITSDYAAAKMFVSSISPYQIATQGTDIAGAIDQAAASMLTTINLKNPNSKAKQNNVIVVISDGEDHFDEAAEIAGDIAKEQGIKTYTIGVGSSKGEPIPIRRNGHIEYKKDNEGNTVITRLNEQTLRDIALAGEGAYIYANNSYLGFDKLSQELDKLEKAEIEDVTYARYESKFYIPLAIALALLAIEVFLYKRKLFNFKLLNKIKQHSMLKIILLFLLSLSVLNGIQAQTHSELQSMRMGNKQYFKAEKLNKDVAKLQQQNRKSNESIIAAKQAQAQNLYQQANTNYIKANASTGNYYKSLYNQAASLYKQGKYEEATKKLDPVVNNGQVSDRVKAKSYYNLGNSLVQAEKYQEGINAYKQALKLNPKDMNAKYNLEYAKKKLYVQQQQQQQQQQNQNQDQQQNQQGQQNQQNKDNKDQQNGQNQQQNQQDKNQQQNKDQQNQQDKNNQNGDQKQESAADRQKREMAKRQLDALQQNEKNTQEKVQLMERSARSVKQEKDW